MRLLAVDVVGWFPGPWSEEFFAIRTGAGVVAVLLVVWNMVQRFHLDTTPGQVMRYYVLLGFASLTVVRGTEAFADRSFEVTYGALGNALLTFLLLATMAVSIREDRHARRIV